MRTTRDTSAEGASDPEHGAHDLHEADFYSWTRRQAALLKAGLFESLDLSDVIEEIETLGRSELPRWRRPVG